MTKRNIILAVCAALCCGMTAQAQKMFLAEENLGDMTHTLPGSPVLYDIVGTPREVVETVFPAGEKNNLMQRTIYRLNGCRVKEIEHTDYTKGEKPTTTLTAFTYNTEGQLQMMTIIDKDSDRVIQEINWKYDKGGKPQRATAKYDVTGYLTDKPGGKYEAHTGPIYLDYNISPEGNITKVTSHHAAQYAPYSVSFRKNGTPERTGNNLKYALPGEAKYRMSQHYQLPESSDGITAAPDGTPINYQREYSYTSEGWLMQMSTNYDGYTDREGNEVEATEEEINYMYETDPQGNWTDVIRVTSTDPEKVIIYSRTYQY